MGNMLGPLRKVGCLKTLADENLSERDVLLWYRDLERHCHGQFSFAVVQANAMIEDKSQVETGNNTTFVGIYDGHGGFDTSNYIRTRLFDHILRLTTLANGTISEQVIRDAFAATEEGFLTVVRRSKELRPTIASIGSCCLVGVINEGTLYVANLGDSRAVLGYLDDENKINAEQLTSDHNANREEVRQELISAHPNDSTIVTQTGTVWRVKGIIQISRSIGDAYLKDPEFALGPEFPKFHLRVPIQGPVLRSDPSITTRALQPNDKFLIFASDGLWEHLSNERAVEIVRKNRKSGVARRLIRAAMREAARKTGRTYKDLKQVSRGDRRNCHDDISVVVIFINHQLLENNDGFPGLSIQSFSNAVGPSKFN